MSQSLRYLYNNLPENIHTQEVQHSRKEYQCEECFETIVIGSTIIRVSEEVAQPYGRSFNNLIMCSKKCLEAHYHLQVKQCK